MIKITLNGKEQEFENELTLQGLIQNLKLNPDQIIAQVNDSKTFSKDKLESYQIKNNDQIELIKFMAGG